MSHIKPKVTAPNSVAKLIRRKRHGN